MTARGSFPRRTYRLSSPALAGAGLPAIVVGEADAEGGRCLRRGGREIFARVGVARLRRRLLLRRRARRLANRPLAGAGLRFDGLCRRAPLASSPGLPSPGRMRRRRSPRRRC
jgi:hypothetical protein